MDLYSTNTSRNQLYSLNYSIVYSAQYMQYLYSHLIQQFNNYRCLDRNLQVYDTVWTGVFLTNCCFLVQNNNYLLYERSMS
jgi:hypothetical protein